jgi:actin-like ATPase involved in cell morphogenesis
MPAPVGHALGVDFGTSHTVAVIHRPDGRARPLLIDGSPLLPSAVYAEPGGALVVGRDAIHSARLDPARFEPNPKRRIDDGSVLLGDREVPVGDLLTAVLARVAEEWRRTVGDVVPTVTLTCPATWGGTRRTVLAEAAARAGLPRARLVAEPVAASTYFADVLGRDVPIGSVVVVHDFGAGTFDASVVVRRSSGFEVLAVDGRDDIGGIDVDAALVGHLRKLYHDRDPAAWQRLDAPTTVEDRRAKRQLWDDVRVAKERLSRAQRADLMLPLLDLEVHVTREELEELARPLLEQTVRMTEGLMRWAKLAEGSVAGVFLVGGSSRIPLMATLLHRALDEPPVVIEQPELVVAEGSVLADAALLATAPAAPGPTSLMHLPGLAGNRADAPGTVTGTASVVAPDAPVSPAGGNAPVSPAGAPVSPAATPMGATPTSPAGPGGAPANGPTVGRVIVPGAATPPGKTRPAGSAPVAPTRQLPRVGPTPNSTIPLPPRERPASGPPPRRTAPPARPVSPPQARRTAPTAPRVDRPARASRGTGRRVARGIRGFVRTIVILVLLTAVPLAAGWVAYQVARGRW